MKRLILYLVLIIVVLGGLWAFNYAMHDQTASVR